MNQTTTNPYIALMKTAWKYAKDEKRKYVFIYLRFACSNLVYALDPIIWGLFINQVQLQGADILTSAWMYVGAYLLVKLGDWYFHGIARVREMDLAFNISQNFLEELYFKAVHLPVRWHQDNHSGATINRIRKAYEALKNFFMHGYEYMNAAAKFLFSFAAMLYFAPLVGTVALLLGVGIVWVIFQFDKPYIATLKAVNEKEHIVSSTLFDSLSNIITVITLRLEKRMEKVVMNRVDDIRPPFRRNVRINEWKWFVVDMLVGMIYGVILLGYVYQNFTPGETFLIGSLVTLMAYVQKFTSVFHNIAWMYTDIVRYDTDVKTAINIIDAYDALEIDEKAAILPKDWRQIEIRDLHFLHQQEDEAVPEHKKMGLKGVNITIQKGQKIAFIGESGSGKSTLLALLRGLYPPIDLKLDLDGLPINQLSLISDHVTLFPQEPEIFENSIEYNITLGLKHDSVELERVAKIAHFSEVVQQLPNGYASKIQEKGVNLSGGQKQRLALARGIFAAKDSELILLDEPTSSVDPKTELKIYDQLFAAFKDKAILSSLHRLHLLPKFDYIYVMDQGRIIDEGTFEELFGYSESFREMWAHQEGVVV
ncbi:MAG: ABC transporter ATP-binding protein [Bacteroidota bacterium]